MFLHFFQQFRFILQLRLPVIHFTSRGVWVAPFASLWSGRLLVLPRLASPYCFDFSKSVNIMSFLYIYLAPSLLQMVPLLLYSQMLPKVIPAAYSSMAFEVFSLCIPSFTSEERWNLELSYSHSECIYMTSCLFVLTNWLEARPCLNTSSPTGLWRLSSWLRQVMATPVAPFRVVSEGCRQLVIVIHLCLDRKQNAKNIPSVGQN